MAGADNVAVWVLCQLCLSFSPAHGGFKTQVQDARQILRRVRRIGSTRFRGILTPPLSRQRSEWFERNGELGHGR